MKKIIPRVLLVCLFLIISPVAPVWAFYDGFEGSSVNSNKWHIPTWVSPTDGTFAGRTQFRTTQNAPLPAVSKGKALIILETHNPTGFSFYGTDLISDKAFERGQGVIVRVRAKLSATVPGLVGGIFLYALKDGDNTNHDEIDFELLSNTPEKVNTNIYGNEPLGAGRPVAVPFVAGTIHDYHIYEIRWFADKVIWSVDGRIIRRVKKNIPSGPMRLHVNVWAPAVEWPEAYSAELKPADNAEQNQVYAMRVDWVSIEPLVRP